MINLADLYKNGVGVERDIPRAKLYYELAAQQFDHFPYLSQGNLYTKDHVKDYSKARYYYEIACEYGNTKKDLELNRIIKKQKIIMKFLRHITIQMRFLSEVNYIKDLR